MWSTYTVSLFVSSSAKFGIFIVVGLNGTLVEAKLRTRDTWICVFYVKTSVLFKFMTVQMPNLTLIETKRIQCKLGELKNLHSYVHRTTYGQYQYPNHASTDADFKKI